MTRQVARVIYGAIIGMALIVVLEDHPPPPAQVAGGGGWSSRTTMRAIPMMAP